MVQVVNLGDQPGSFHWQSAGFLGSALFGGSGTEPIAACAVYRRGFFPGPNEITIDAGSDSVTFTAEAPTAEQVDYAYVIEANGTIEQVAGIQAAPKPSC